MCLLFLARLGCVWDVDLSRATGPAAAEEPLDALFEADQALLAAGEQVADAATDPPRRADQAGRPALDALASLQEKSARRARHLAEKFARAQLRPHLDCADAFDYGHGALEAVGGVLLHLFSVAEQLLGGLGRAGVVKVLE